MRTFLLRSNAQGIETISGKVDKLEVRNIDIKCDFRSAGNKQSHVCHASVK